MPTNLTSSLVRMVEGQDRPAHIESREDQPGLKLDWTEFDRI